MSSALDTTKEIVVAAIQNRFIILPDESYENDQQLSKLNEKRANELASFIKIVAKSIDDANNKRF